MFDRQSLHIALLMWGCIFSLIAALCMFMSKNFDKEKRRLILTLLLLTALLLGMDAATWDFRGDAGRTAYYMVRISNFFVFAVSDVILWFFHAYVCCCLFEKRKEQRKGIFRVKLVYAICMVGVLLVILSQFIHLYYYFDADNFYHRSGGYILSVLLPFAGMLLDFSLLIQYRKNVEKEILVSLISYILLPFVALIIQTFYYGISLINIAISISMILMFVVAMEEQNQNLARKEKEAADLKISLMLSQIAPHFVYNALTTIQQLCVKDPKMAQETVGEFAAYLRGNLDALNKEECIPFEKELQHVKHYLAIEKKRFGDRVNVIYDIQEEDFVLPPLTLQPIVENAVKHGICKKREGGTIHIHTEKTDHEVRIIVEDDGVGFDSGHLPEDGRAHVGIKNVTDRLKSFGSGSLTVTGEPGKGTVAVITLPQRG